jgi:hypothetical protein
MKDVRKITSNLSEVINYITYITMLFILSYSEQNAKIELGHPILRMLHRAPDES